MSLAQARDLVAAYWRRSSFNWHPRLKSLSDYVVGEGKAFRPALLFWSYQNWSDQKGQPPESVVAAALALELIHTYSLVHDDLPAMDDDDFRRGRPTVHRLSNDATAVLVGDTLLTAAFEVIARSSNPDAVKTGLVLELSSAAGGAGMVGGQQLDIEGGDLSLEKLRELHRLKTGALFGAALSMASILAAPQPDKKFQTRHEKAREWGVELGLLFQIADDLIDAGEEGPSFVKLMGVEGAKAAGEDLKKKLLSDASELGLKNGTSQIVESVFNRSA